MRLFVFVIFCLISLSSFSQDKATIMGRIVEKTDGKPISGVSVVCKGTTYGAFTDNNGKFLIFVNRELIM